MEGTKQKREKTTKLGKCKGKDKEGRNNKNFKNVKTEKA